MYKPNSPPFLRLNRTRPKTNHRGSNLGSNIGHSKKILLMWHVVNEERDV